MGTYRLLPLFLILLFCASCADDQSLRESGELNDEVFVEVSFDGPLGEVGFQYDISERAIGLAAAGLFERGFTHPQGLSVVSYLAQPTITTENLLVAGCNRLQVTDDFEQLYGNPFGGDFFLEILTETSGNERCFPEAGDLRNTIREGTIALGQEIGQANVFMTGRFGRNRTAINLHHFSGGEMTIHSVDEDSGPALGVPGIYFNFEIHDATFIHPETDDTYVSTFLAGRLFVELVEG